MSDSPLLYHFPPSLCSQKVRLALREKGVDYRERLVDIGPSMENYEAWYARINPRMVVPTLQVGGACWTDSAAIVDRIDRHFDGPDLGAEDGEVRRFVALQDGLRIREVAYSKTTGIMGFLAKGSFDKRLAVLETMKAQHPELAELYQARIDDVHQWKEDSATPETIALDKARIEDALAQAESALENRPFLAGDRYTLADVTWTVLLARLRFMRVPVPSRLGAHYQQMKARPSFRTADIWERLKPLRMAPVVGAVLAQRLGLERGR